ncbi:MAG: DNA repair protein RecO [Chloroflexi bacterium]|nr:DNA repair protein RecO [Chloroflexota bacterium]
MTPPSTKPRLFKVEAVVLKQYPLGEADRLLVLYTPELGKLRAVAKGARRPSSKLGGHVEPLVHTRLLLARGGSLDVVSQAEAVHAFPGLREDLGRLAQALYCAELVDAFTPDEQASPPLFGLLVEALATMEEGAEAVFLHCFELRLLALAGYQPQLRHCAECEGPIEPGQHWLSYRAGGVLCPRCAQGVSPPPAPVSLNALKSLRYLQEQPYGRAQRLRLGPEVGAEVRGLLRGYIRYLLEKDLKSTEFLDHLRREGMAPWE